MSDDELERSNDAYALLDMPWCVTCKCRHIPTIPVTTFQCADCGFGAWEFSTAEDHATRWPEHVVFPAHHATVSDRPVAVPEGSVVVTADEQDAIREMYLIAAQRAQPGKRWERVQAALPSLAKGDAQ